jgi:hypothetical protein
MKHALRTTIAILGFAAAADAQIHSVLFTGRFPFVSRGSVNERPGGAISRMEEFDISMALPLPGGSTVATTLLPSTAMQCYLGDGNNDGVYTKFHNWKTYFQAINIGGVFVKAADRTNASWDKVFFTLRRNAAATGAAAVGGLQFEVLTNNGTTPYTMVPGDWVRLLPNGNVEFFMTAAQLAVAVGAQSGAATIGAGALLQAANGDLYYSPVDGSHWVNGNQSGVVNAQDGAILKIDAANIVYDASGNVASFAPNSARLLINESVGGPGSTLHVRQIVLNAGGMDRAGNPLAVAGVYGKTCGLAFDPNGGTWTPSFPDATGAFNPEPNLLWVSDPGSYGGTIFSTAFNGATNGSIAVINGALCGSTTPGVPADGAWLGVNLDAPNFQPTLMGFTLVDGIVNTGLLLDQNNFGSLPVAATQPNWEMDIFGTPFTPAFVLLDLGPSLPGMAVPSIPISLLPPILTADSWKDLFFTTSPVTMGVTVLDSFGYGTVSIPNPNTGGFTGFTFMAHALALQPTAFQLSSPVLVQLQ